MEEVTRKFDLHIHTEYSDGTFTPEQVVLMAVREKVNMIAISDHDTVSGVREAELCGEKYGITVVPSVEFDNEWPHELHIMGLDVDLEHPVLLRAMEVARERRDKRNAIILSQLKENGMDIAPYMCGGKSATTKLHIAQAIIRAGYAKEVKEAFAKYLRPGTPGYYTEKRFTPQQVLEIIYRADGISVLAHPCHIRDNFHGLFRELVSMGLLGIEAFYPTNTTRQTELYLSLARQHRLIPTCGSDFHGANRPGVPIGCAWKPNDALDKTYETLMRRLGK